MSNNYKIISNDNDFTGFGKSNEQFNISKYGNTLLDSRFNKIDFHNENEVEITIVFKFNFVREDEPTIPYVMFGTSVVMIRDINSELKKKLNSEKSIDILSDIVSNKMTEFYYHMNGKYFELFNAPLVGSKKITKASAVHQVKVMLSILQYIKSNGNQK